MRPDSIATCRVRLLVVGLFALAGCARDVVAVYPGRGEAPGRPTGAIAVELTQAASDVTVVVGGALVASRSNTRRVLVVGVPAGLVAVDVAFGGGSYARAEHHSVVEVVPGATTTVALPGPEQSVAGAIASGFSVLGMSIWMVCQYALLL